MTEKIKKQIFEIREDHHKANAVQAIIALVPDKKTPFKIVISPGSEDRSSKQRRLQFMWYTERGKLSGHGKDYEEKYLKLNFGVQILRCESDEFNEFYATALDHLTYEQKLNAMKFVPVTRLMSVKQNVEYLNDIEQDSAENGWPLTHPSDLYMAALMKHYQ